jgi:hypothetical protein
MCWCQKRFLKNKKTSLTCISARKVILKATATTLPNTLLVVAWFEKPQWHPKTILHGLVTRVGMQECMEKLLEAQIFLISCTEIYWCFYSSIMKWFYILLQILKNTTASRRGGSNSANADGSSWTAIYIQEECLDERYFQMISCLCELSCKEVVWP